MLFGEKKVEVKKIVFIFVDQYFEVLISFGIIFSNFIGDWRIFIFVVNEDKCVKCYICWKFCLELVIYIKFDGYVVIDYDYCKGCGICVNECLIKVIIMEKEEK